MWCRSSQRNRVCTNLIYIYLFFVRLLDIHRIQLKTMSNRCTFFLLHCDNKKNARCSTFCSLDGFCVCVCVCYPSYVLFVCRQTWCAYIIWLLLLLLVAYSFTFSFFTLRHDAHLCAAVFDWSDFFLQMCTINFYWFCEINYVRIMRVHAHIDNIDTKVTQKLTYTYSHEWQTKRFGKHQ